MLEKIRSGTDSIRELLIIYVVAATIVALAFAFFEGYGLYEAYWWTFITGLTIGYGDIYPSTIGGQILTVVWTHFMILLILPLFVSRIIMLALNKRNEFSSKEQEELLEAVRYIKDNTSKKRKRNVKNTSMEQ